MLLWEADGYVAGNWWEAMKMWTEYTVAGTIFAIGVQFVVSVIFLALIVKFIGYENINN